MKLLRLILAMGAVGGLVYVAVKVPLGTQTLWGHLQAIARTEESQKLVHEVKHKAKQVLGRDAAPAPARGDDLTETERRLLRELIREKLGQHPPEGRAPGGTSGGDPPPP